MEFSIPFVLAWNREIVNHGHSLKLRFNINAIRFSLVDFIAGTSILRILKQLRFEQYLPSDILCHQQKTKLNALFKSAVRSTRFYAGYASYEHLPILTKDMVKQQPNSFVSSAFKERIYPKATGGSTGIPLLYYTTKEARSFMWAGILLSWESAGYQIGEKVAFVSGTSLSKSDFKHNLFYWLMNIQVFSAYHLDDSAILSHVQKIQKSRVRIIYGYASALDTIATFINSNPSLFIFPFLKGIISTAEVLTDSMRNNISKAFKVEVYNQYGCNEAGVSAFECEHHTMHLISSRCYYETSASGHLISTDLSNKGYIMMKYNTGDIVEITDQKQCPCLRNYPIIKKVIGRSFDVIHDMNNNVLHSAFFNILFRSDPAIRQYQIRYSRTSLQVFLRVDNLTLVNSDYSAYMETIKAHLRFTTYELILNAPFMQSKNAKHRHIVFMPT
jgi:phenylacetate-CoA ligase